MDSLQQESPNEGPVLSTGSNTGNLVNETTLSLFSSLKEILKENEINEEDTFILTDVFYQDNRGLNKGKIGVFIEKSDSGFTDTILIDINPIEYDLYMKYKLVNINQMIDDFLTNTPKTTNPTNLNYIIQVNPDDYEKIELGHKVIIEGSVIDFTVVEYSKNKKPKSAILTIKSSNNHHFSIHIEASLFSNIKLLKKGMSLKINTVISEYNLPSLSLSAIENNDTVLEYLYKKQAEEENSYKKLLSIQVDLDNCMENISTQNGDISKLTKKLQQLKKEKKKYSLVKTLSFHSINSY